MSYLRNRNKEKGERKGKGKRKCPPQLYTMFL